MVPARLTILPHPGHPRHDIRPLRPKHHHHHMPRRPLQRSLQIRKHRPHHLWPKRIEHIDHQLLIRKLERSSIPMDRLDIPAPLPPMLVRPNIRQRLLMQVARKLYSHHPAKRILRRHKQHTPFTGTHIDKRVLRKVPARQIPQRRMCICNSNRHIHLAVANLPHHLRRIRYCHITRSPNMPRRIEPPIFSRSHIRSNRSSTQRILAQ